MLNGQILLAFSNGKVLKFDAYRGNLKAKTDLGIDISNGLIAVNTVEFAATKLTTNVITANDPIIDKQGLKSAERLTNK